MADGRNGAGNGSRLYELNAWMWRYGRGQPRRVTVGEAELQRKAAISDARTRAAETLKRRKTSEGRITTAEDPRKRVRDLPRIENLRCYIASYIP